jgi:hypothetical protein
MLRFQGALLDRGPITRMETVVIAVTSVAFAVVFCFPLVRHLTTAGVSSDWDLVLGTQWAAYWTVRQYHQFPFWNPFECGGIPLLGDPVSHFLTPWFLLTLTFGPEVGLHLEVVILCAIGWAGGYVLGRLLGMRRISAVATATAFAGSSWFFLHASEGQMFLLALAYLPWIVAGAWAASEKGKLRYAVLSGALIALSFFEGGPYPVLYEGLTLALLMVFRALVQLDPRPLTALGVAAAFAIGFPAFKCLPVLEVIASHPRPTGEGWSNLLYALGQALLSRYQDHSRPSPNGWGFWELGAYVGIFAVIAVAALRFPRRSLPWILTGVVVFQLARGWTSPNCLWVWLHRLPLFSSTRLPARLLIPFVLIIATLAGLGLDAICKGGSIAAVAISGLLVIVGGADLLLVGPPNLRYAFVQIAGPWSAPRTFVQYRLAPASKQSATIQHKEGVVNCYVYTNWPTPVKGENEAGYRGEQYMDGPGVVRLLRWTPNALRFEVDTPAPSVLVINQNYDPSWRVTSGGWSTFSKDGLLAVRVAAGKNIVVVRYVSLLAFYGLAITVLTTFGAVMFIRTERSRSAPKSAT